MTYRLSIVLVLCLALLLTGCSLTTPGSSDEPDPAGSREADTDPGGGQATTPNPADTPNTSDPNGSQPSPDETPDTEDAPSTAPLRVDITITGPGYDASGTTTASSRQSSRPRIFRTGTASLEISFSAPVDRTVIEETVFRQLRRQSQGPAPGRVIPQEPEWRDNGRVLSVPVQQQADPHDPLTPFDETRHLRLDLRDIDEAADVPVEEEGARLHWFVAPALDVYRSAPLSAEGEVAGQMAAVNGLQAAGAARVQDGRLLTWQTVRYGVECSGDALSVWNLEEATVRPVDGVGRWCHGAAAWGPDGDHVLLHGPSATIRRFAVAALPSAGETVYTMEEGHLLNAAFSSDGQIAAFVTEPERRQGSDVHLMVTGVGTDTEIRVDDAAALVATETVWNPIPAAWSPDGSSLAFVAVNPLPPHEDGVPRRATGPVTLWDDGSLQTLGVEAEALHWRPATDHLLLLQGERWRLYDVASETWLDTELPLPRLVGDIGWSPEGRYLTWIDWIQVMRGGDGVVVHDLATGDQRRGRFVPLGWDDDGRLYWVEGG